MTVIVAGCGVIHEEHAVRSMMEKLTPVIDTTGKENHFLVGKIVQAFTPALVVQNFNGFVGVFLPSLTGRTLAPVYSVETDLAKGRLRVREELDFRLDHPELIRVSKGVQSIIVDVVMRPDSDGIPSCYKFNFYDGNKIQSRLLAMSAVENHGSG